MDKIRTKLSFATASSFKEKIAVNVVLLFFIFVSHGCTLNACKLSDVSSGEVIRSLVALLPKEEN